jgi:hypothetical protein
MQIRSATLSKALPAWALVPTFLILAFPTSLIAQDWVEFTEETLTRMVADVSVGSGDVEEKDLISGDIDRDGDMDLIVARKTPFSNAGGKRNVLFMNENGVMTDRTSTLAPDFLDLTDDRDVVMVDVDGDMWLDVVTVTTFSEQPRVYMNLGENGVGVWLGIDYEATDNRLPTFNPGPKFCAVGFADVTGSNGPDLFFVDYDNDLEDRLLINDGSGFFTDQTDSRMTPAMAASTFGTDAHIVDIDGDGDNDILKNNASGSSGTNPDVRVLYNDGTGNFDFAESINTDAPYMIEVGDLNGDGLLDVYVVDDGQDHVLFNTGNNAGGRAQFNTVTVTTSSETQGFGGNTKFADLDLDGVLDILVADVDTDLASCARRMAVLQGLGVPPNISYSDPLNGVDRTWLPNGVFDIEPIDIDGNGVLDLWIGTCTGNRIFMNLTDPGTLFKDGFESGNTLGWSIAVP